MVRAVFYLKHLFHNHTKKLFWKSSNKLLSKPALGKSVERERNERDIAIVRNKKLRNKHVSSLQVKEITFLTGDLQLIKKDRKVKIR